MDVILPIKNMNSKTLYLNDYTAPYYLVTEVNLVFEMLAEDNVRVRSKLFFEKKGESDILELNCDKNPKIESVKVNGEDIEFNIDGDILTLKPGKDSFVLEIESMIDPSNNKSCMGLYCSNGNFVTQCESQGFRKITPFVDRPDNMSVYTTTIIADPKKYPVMLCNGNLVASKDLDDGRREVTFHDPFRKPCYLFALVVAGLEAIEDKYLTGSGKEVRLGIYVEKGDEGRVAHAMQALKDSMKWDEETFGLECDLDEFKIVAVNDFNFGAMENKGLNIFNAPYVLADPKTATDSNFFNVEAVVAHEYFHNWTGNRVTCRDWFQLTLKEGLTVFRDQEFSSDMHSRTVCRISDVRGLRASQFLEDSGPNAHPIRPQSAKAIENFYTSTVYDKGAEVIRMIHTLIGKEKFRKGMDLYFERHDGQAVTCDDFVAAMADASGFNLDQFRETWYNQKGTPTCEVVKDFKEGVLSLTVKQTPFENGDKPFMFPLSVGLIGEDGQDVLSKLLIITKEEETFEFAGLESEPVVSLLRNFSAPVKLKFDYKDDDLKFMMMHDSDGFNRYEASNQLIKAELLRLIADAQEDKELKADASVIEAFEKIILDCDDDPAFAAEILTLPGITSLVQEFEVYDYQATYDARKFLVTEIAKVYEEQFVEIYDRYNVVSEFKTDSRSVGERTIKNLAMMYLSRLNNKFDQRLVAQHTDATNMTDEIAALGMMANKEDLRDVEGEKFYQKWKHNPLVFNKWLLVQMSAQRDDLLDLVKKLEKLPEFNSQNANNISYLYNYGFCGNLMKFFVGNAEHYKFIVDKILEVDAFNPNAAARLVKVFQNLKKLKSVDQELIRAQLQRVVDADCSSNVSEIAEKILA